MKQYLDALKYVLDNGQQVDDRTGYASHAPIKAAMAV